MAIIRRVTRIANPRRRVRKVRRVKAVRRHNTARRKRSAPVIRRYSVKTLKKELRRRGVKANPSARRRKVRRTIKRRNPVLLEFGALNPHKKRRKSVARKHRRSRNTRRRHAVARVHHRRRRRNPVVTVHNRRRRRRNSVARNRHHYRRRRNPAGINKQLVEMAGGVLIGVAATKYLPTLIPASLTGMIPSSSFTVPLVTGVGAAMAGYLAHKFLPGGVAAGVVAGGAALTLSRLLDVVAPASISSQLSLSGVGDIVPTMGFAVPDRSMRQQVVQMPGAGVGFYRRRRG
jgi:hypothetical protein